MSTEQPEAADPMIRLVTRQVDRLVKRSRRDRFIQVVLVLVCAALVAGGVVIYNNQQASCRAGNAYRSGNQQIWTKFIGLLTPPGTKPAELAIARSYLAYVGKVDAQRQC